MNIDITEILWTVQKSGIHQLIWRISHYLQGCYPSQVVKGFLHQQYQYSLIIISHQYIHDQFGISFRIKATSETIDAWEANNVEEEGMFVKKEVVLGLLVKFGKSKLVQQSTSTWNLPKWPETIRNLKLSCGCWWTFFSTLIRIILDHDDDGYDGDDDDYCIIILILSLLTRVDWYFFGWVGTYQLLHFIQLLNTTCFSAPRRRFTIGKNSLLNTSSSGCQSWRLYMLDEVP